MTKIQNIHALALLATLGLSCCPDEQPQGPAGWGEPCAQVGLEDNCDVGYVCGQGFCVEFCSADADCSPIFDVNGQNVQTGCHLNTCGFLCTPGLGCPDVPDLGVELICVDSGAGSGMCRAE